MSFITPSCDKFLKFGGEMPEAQYLYLTTIGRKTGNPHEIEIWFVEYEGNYYLVSEYPDRSDWVKNIDRKSTRLNSSHVKISYAVFCLKKKKHHYRASQ